MQPRVNRQIRKSPVRLIDVDGAQLGVVPLDEARQRAEESGLDLVESTHALEFLAELGVVLLLFEVGLESNVREMMSVGMSSLIVAILGVVAPFFLGWGVSAWMLPDEDLLVHIFIGATLCATSVGITARVLTDLGKVATREAKIIQFQAILESMADGVIVAEELGEVILVNAAAERMLGIHRQRQLDHRRHARRTTDGPRDRDPGRRGWL